MKAGNRIQNNINIEIAISTFAIIKNLISIFLIFLLGFNLFGLYFFYLGKIQLCKIKADEYSDAEYKIPERSMVIFSSDTKGIELINKKEILADGKNYMTS